MSRKRKAVDNFFQEKQKREKKRRKREEKNPEKNLWVSATDTYNYLCKDSLVDYLKFMEQKNRSITREKNIDDFSYFIQEQGRNFENKVVNILKNKFNLETVSEIINTENCEKVKELMKKKVQIIHSAPFLNEKNKTKGVIDLLVHSSVLPTLTNTFFPVNLPDCYVVIDIKFSTLPLRADGKHLLNSGHYTAYKGQLWIYTQALENLQNYIPKIAFILGRRWCYTNKGIKYSSLSCTDRLGYIDFTDIDREIIQQTDKAISWIRDLRENAENWSISPPSRPELYPNLCITSGKYDSIKKELSDKINEITKIWYCGHKNREYCFSEGITSWKDERCNSKTLRITGERGKIIDEILNINRSDKNKILPLKITSNLYDWKNKNNEAFVDFETFLDVFDVTDSQKKSNGIFMIGIWYNNEYRDFTVKNLTHEEEYRICTEFYEYIREIGNPRLWFWYAEENIWTSAQDRFEKEWNLNWTDLSKIFRNEPIVIKNCFSYGLKEVSQAMREHGFITEKIESKCNNGLMAAVKAWRDLNENKQVPNDIKLYNKFDVKVLWEIINYLREKHI